MFFFYKLIEKGVNGEGRMKGFRGFNGKSLRPCG